MKDVSKKHLKKMCVKYHKVQDYRTALLYHLRQLSRNCSLLFSVFFWLNVVPSESYQHFIRAGRNTAEVGEGFSDLT